VGREFIAQAVSEGFLVESRETTVTMNNCPVTVVRHNICQGLP
jgi:hypothetical protein